MIKRIRIAGVDWEVVQVDHLIERASAYGMMFQHRQAIEIEAGLPGSLERQSLLHEVIHVLWRNAALGKTAREETVVEAIANGLNQVFADNPVLLTVLFDWPTKKGTRK